jgi:hypothetical protein
MRSASEKAAAVSALRNDSKQMELRAGAKKDFETNSQVSSLLQVCPSLTFQLRNPGSIRSKDSNRSTPSFIPDRVQGKLSPASRLFHNVILRRSRRISTS